ncbi:endo-rhamnogalacturonase F [Coleophoma cylindrospora]|uniref:Endo-rhamnogalacturonase F n=1 Tax=Coleophoma cylindrospora TaxID=1849047 RepID=A0A3D8QFH9_9HELO|nr:endo-rhamnogalacturonase F [Coleophoma cylindrospora]
MISPLRQLSIFFLVLSLTYAQLIDPVGPTTPLSEKKHECNVLDYGAVADNSTDIAGPLSRAFEHCSFQLDGLITAKFSGNWTVDRSLILQGSAGVTALNTTINGEGDGFFLSDLIVIVNGTFREWQLFDKHDTNSKAAVDFELFSENGRGAIQGQGYLYRNGNVTERPRMLRLISPVNASVHDLLLIDSPKFHFVFDFGINIEVYHLTIRGANLGSYDGIDAIGYNYWVHDNEVTNRDECVSVKSPTNHALVTDLVCNHVGSGISIGSLNVSASIANVHAANISVLYGNEIAFIKTYPGGSGFVTNITWENFRSKESSYGFNIDQYWQNKFTPDTGSVALTNLVFKNFTGSINGTRWPPINIQGNDLTFATNVSLQDFSIWMENGTKAVNQISNVFATPGNGNDASYDIPTLVENQEPTAYTSLVTLTTTPPGWTVPTWPAWAAPSTGYGTASPIPVYTPAALWRPQGDYDLHYWGSF